jgi:hypothetical protein
MGNESDLLNAAIRSTVRWNRLLLAGLLAGFLGGVACDGDDGLCVPESVVVTPETVSFDAFGQTQQLSAVARCADGSTASGVSFTWASSDENVATVSGGGLVTAEGNGDATVTASATGLDLDDSADVTVEQVATQLGFATQPGDALAEEAFGTQPTVEVQDANGNIMADDNATEVEVAIGTNPADGVLSGNTTATVVSGVATFTDLDIDTPGSGYTLTASATGLSDATSDPFDVAPNVATIEVSPTTLSFSSLTEEATLTAVARSPSGAEVDVSLDWVSADPSVCSVSDGVVTAVGNGGPVIITASFNDQVTSNDVECTVEQVPAEITVAPEFAVLAVGETAPLTIGVNDALGNEIVSPTCSIDPDDAGVASVSGTDVTGVAPGVTDVVVTCDAQSERATFAVVAQSGFAMLLSNSVDRVRIAAGAGSTLVLDLWMIRPTGGDGDLAALSGTLTWDAAELTYVESAVVESGFTWVPNETDVSNGNLTFGGFAATGTADTFVLAQITFDVSGSVGGGSALNPTATAAGNTNGDDILVLIQAVSSEVEIE